MVRYNWNVEMKGQQCNIEVQLDNVLDVFATGGGRLVVNEKIISHWGCSPFTLIPKGKLDFQVAGKKVYIITTGTITNSLALVLDDQEIPPIVAKS
jgi:hypothetical protein